MKSMCTLGFLGLLFFVCAGCSGDLRSTGTYSKKAVELHGLQVSEVGEMARLVMEEQGVTITLFGLTQDSGTVRGTYVDEKEAVVRLVHVKNLFSDYVKVTVVVLPFEVDRRARNIITEMKKRLRK